MIPNYDIILNMRKLFLTILSIIICSICAYADMNTQYIEMTVPDIEPVKEESVQHQQIQLETMPVKSYNLKRKKIINPSSDNYKTTTNKDIQDSSLTNPNTKRSFKTDNKKKVKDFSFGTQSTHTMTSDTYSGTNTLYTEYEKKNFKLNTGYTKNTTPNQNNQDKGTVSVSPEYKFNQHFSIQNKNSTNLNDNSQKTELNLKVTPFKDDRMDLGVGVGQKHSQNAPSSSQFGFTTNLRF